MSGEFGRVVKLCARASSGALFNDADKKSKPEDRDYSSSIVIRDEEFGWAKKFARRYRLRRKNIIPNRNPAAAASEIAERGCRSIELFSASPSEEDASRT
jgi:hypothetical protein